MRNGMETEALDAAAPVERNKAGMLTGVGKLSWPLILAYLGQDLLRIIDHVMLGNYDPTVLAGVGIADGVMWMHFAIGIGLAGAADTLIAQSVGAEKPGHLSAASGTDE
jgi:Na+-driven multidrug efflux pump